MVTKKTILRHIGAHDGKWGWYQLERVIDPRKLASGNSVMGIINALMQEGLIVQLLAEPMPYYALTDLGRAQYDDITAKRQ